MVPVILALREELMREPETEQQKEYLRNIEAVLAELGDGATGG